MKKTKRTFVSRGSWSNLLLIAVFLGLFAIAMAVNHYSVSNVESIVYTDLLSLVDKGQIESAVVDGHNLSGKLKNGKSFTSSVIPSDKLWDNLRKAGVKLSVVDPKELGWLYHFLSPLFSILLVLAAFALFSYLRFSSEGSGGSPGKILSIVKNKSRLYTANELGIKFRDVAGVEEAKEDLSDIIKFLKNPRKFGRIGARIPLGILLSGEPGNGKTMLAKAVAGEASCPFFSISGSDFMELFVGVGASRVRDLFAQARKHAPCIVFIDEIDAVGQKRGSGNGGNNDEREQTLNQLLSEMDGFATTPGSVIVLAATNRVDILDSALLRPGRFDRIIEVPYPDLRSRAKILAVHAKKIKMSGKVCLDLIARGTAGFSGAQLANLVNEAALYATKTGKNRVGIEDFEFARDKIIIGAARKTLVQTEDNKRRTACHESGHTLLNLLLPETDPFHKVTIVPHGKSLGASWSLPEHDVYSVSSEQMLSRIMVALGGMVAEKFLYDDTTSGVCADLRDATNIARNMVCSYGMSKLGTVAYQRGSYMYYTESRHSEETAAKIDEEIRRIIEECRERAEELLVKNRDRLDILIDALVKHETLQADEVYKLLSIAPRELHSFSPGVSSGKDSGSKKGPVKKPRKKGKS